ncbi:COX assembly mitochondrial protein homolog, partial [Cyanocitta cristata]
LRSPPDAGRSGRSGRVGPRLRCRAGEVAAQGVRSCRRCVGPQMEPPPGAAENSKLRHVEKDVLIPQIMRDRAKELCSDKVQEFGGKPERLHGRNHRFVMTTVSSSYENEKRMLHYYLQLHFCERKHEEVVSPLWRVRMVQSEGMNLSKKQSLAFLFSLLHSLKAQGGWKLLHPVLQRSERKPFYSDPSFYEECKAEYLKQREEYRATGIKKKRQKLNPNV